MAVVAVPAELADVRLLTIAEVASAAKVGRTTIYEEIAAGRLKSVKVRNSRRIPLKSAKEYLAGLTGGDLRCV